jgi:hypothetical protein
MRTRQTDFGPIGPVRLVVERFYSGPLVHCHTCRKLAKILPGALDSCQPSVRKTNTQVSSTNLPNREEHTRNAITLQNQSRVYFCADIRTLYLFDHRLLPSGQRSVDFLSWCARCLSCFGYLSVLLER